MKLERENCEEKARVKGIIGKWFGQTEQR